VDRADGRKCNRGGTQLKEKNKEKRKINKEKRKVV